MRAALTAFFVAVSLIAFTPSAQAREALTIDGGATSASDSTPVTLDADVFVPDVTPAPAVILAHGFGGSKESMTDQAQKLADRGYVVVSYTARGFGASTGTISMNSPNFEIADARAIVDYLATRPDVQLNEAGDPVVGVAGGSYGGALSLMLAGYDQRIDAVASDITWNDLQPSLFGQSAPDFADTEGVYKKLWTSGFFSVGLRDSDGKVTKCGRFSAEWCAAYFEAAESGTVSPETAALMRASSPITITDNITAPTLLMGGQADSLFPLAQVNANAEQIRAANPDTPLSVVWHGAGHDGGIDESERLQDLIATWFDIHLRDQSGELPAFEATLTSGTISLNNSRPDATVLQAPEYPGLFGEQQQTVSFAGESQTVRAPAGGEPAAVTVLPGLGGALGSLVSLPIADGQAAAFESEPFAATTTMIGSSTARIRVSAQETVEDVALFASLRIVSPSGRETLPQGLVAPIRLDSIGPTPTDVTVDLPAIVASVNAGDRLRLVVGTTDFAYRLPIKPALYQIELASPTVSIPLVTTTQVSAGIPPYWWLVGGAILVIGIIVVSLLLRPRRPSPQSAPDLAHVPLATRELTKTFKGGLTAVDHVTFDVPEGVVLGLLGPNGAGKTTTMRMAMGLIRPTDGEIYVFGERIYPGAPVLARIGSLVEGAGFLPHLTGRANLELYWKSAGRSHDESYLDEVLDIADLGTAIERKVKTYSQGMRQRLGIAQAMLGKPDLLMLDEPTNGLDPPQIKAMRDVLQRYAATGRTVIVSSHMLSEVEQTCSHVVVMHRGQVLATGRVDDLLRGRTGLRLEDVFMEIVGEDLTVGQL